MLLQKTLLALQADRLNVNLGSLLDECLQYLIDVKIVLVREEAQPDDENSDAKLPRLVYETTKLGKATVEGLCFELSAPSHTRWTVCPSGSVELGLASLLYDHLRTSLINVNLENPLHLLYITMPFDLPTMTIGFRQLVDRVRASESS